jgi:hypothetical protein
MNKLEKALRNKLDPETTARLYELEAMKFRKYEDNIELQVLRSLYRGGLPPNRQDKLTLVQNCATCKHDCENWDKPECALCFQDVDKHEGYEEAE